MSQPPSPEFIASLREEEEEEEEEDQLDDHLGPGQDPLSKLFCPNGVPCRFFLHDSLTTGMKAEVTKKIEEYGGETTTRERHAKIILVSESRLPCTLETLQLRYDRNEDEVLRNIYVKPLGYIKLCTNMGIFKLGKEKTIKMGMPGPRPREGGHVYRERVNFSDLDDHHLCRYLAVTVPDKKDGGRTGNKIYLELEELGKAFPDDWNWARRHTWHSWRNRYNKNQEALDLLINQWTTRGRRKDGKGEYGRARKPRREVRVIRDSDSEPEGNEVDIDVEEDPQIEDGEEDLYASVKKRRHKDRSDAHKGRKKRRVAELQDVEVGRGLSAKEKGKGKGKQREEPRNSPNPFGDYDMVEFDFGNDDINMPHNEPGPSNTQRSPSLVLPPSPTLVQSKGARYQPLPTQGETSSQATAVATQYQPSARAAQPHVNPLQNLSNMTAVARKKSAPSQTTGGGGAARKTAPKRAPNAPVAPLPAQEEQPPFRNTRARSRSLEPIMVAKAKDKSRGKGKKTPILQSVFEDQAARAEVDIPALSLTQTGPTRETYEEEEAVHQLLSEGLMESHDDAQVRMALENPGQVGGAARDTEDEDESEEEDELEKLLKARDAKAKATTRSKPLASRPQTNMSPMAGQSAYNLNNVSTPVPNRRTRSTRAAAVSALGPTFPSPGSRARVVREQQEEELKRAPYEPPVGTRASVLKAKLLS